MSDEREEDFPCVVVVAFETPEKQLDSRTYHGTKSAEATWIYQVSYRADEVHRIYSVTPNRFFGVGAVKVRGKLIDHPATIEVGVDVLIELELFPFWNPPITRKGPSPVPWPQLALRQHQGAGLVNWPNGPDEEATICLSLTNGNDRLCMSCGSPWTRFPAVVTCEDCLRELRRGG